MIVLNWKAWTCPAFWIRLGLVWLAGGWCLAALGDVFDDFDYGPGIASREEVAPGTGIYGFAPREGDGYWRTSEGAYMPTFAGLPGKGNGFLDMAGPRNSWANLEVDLSEGMVTARIEFSLAEEGTHGARGFYFGFQDPYPDNVMLTLQETDTIWVRVRADSVAMRVQVDEFRNNHVNREIRFEPHADLVLELTYYLGPSTVIAELTGGSETFYRVVSFEGKPQLGAVAMNVVDMPEMRIDAVRVER